VTSDWMCIAKHCVKSDSSDKRLDVHRRMLSSKQRSGFIIRSCVGFSVVHIRRHSKMAP